MYKEYGWNRLKYHVSSTDYIYPHIKNILDKELKHNNIELTILDVGCGNGEIANRLIKDGFDVMGCDASLEGIRLANMENAGHFFVMNLEEETNLPHRILDMKFNVIICTEVIEHLYAPRELMKFCSKLLKPNGLIAISTPYHGYIKNLLISIFGGWDCHFTALWDGGHIKFWSRFTINKLLEEFDFYEQEFKGCGRIKYLWKSMIVVARRNGESLSGS